jgi:DNA-binding transcriptional LysR family regulator
MVFVERPRHVTGEEAEAWLERELAALDSNGVDSIRLKRVVGASPRLCDTWSWMVQIDCRDIDAAREAVGNGPGVALLADLRLLGMRPSVALVEDGS